MVYEAKNDIKSRLNEVFDIFQNCFINCILEHLPSEMHYYQQEDLSSLCEYLEKKVKKQQDKEFMSKLSGS